MLARATSASAAALVLAVFTWAPSSSLVDGARVLQGGVQPTFGQLPEHAADAFIVKYKPEALGDLVLPSNVVPLDPGSPMHVVRVPPGGDVAAALGRWSAKQEVEFVATDDFVYPAEAPPVIPNDPEFSGQWALSQIGAEEAWAADTGAANPAAAVTVCVADSGVDYKHPDLVANLAPAIGYNALLDNSDPMDDLSHGTHIAGIIAAQGNNSLDVTGINWHNVKVLSCKFIDADGVGRVSNAIKCLNYCRQQGAKVINMSWSGSKPNPAMEEAIRALEGTDTLLVVAAGNSGLDLDSAASFPASYSPGLTNMLVVASTNQADALSGFSNYGGAVHLAAPGEQILSTVPGGATAPFTGTSMAAPMAAGAAALVLASAGRPLAPAQLKRVLMESADKLPSLQGKVASGGRLRLDKAVDMVKPPAA